MPIQIDQVKSVDVKLRTSSRWCGQETCWCWPAALHHQSASVHLSSAASRHQPPVIQTLSFIVIERFPLRWRNGILRWRGNISSFWFQVQPYKKNLFENFVIIVGQIKKIVGTKNWLFLVTAADCGCDWQVFKIRTRIKLSTNKKFHTGEKFLIS